MTDKGFIDENPVGEVLGVALTVVGGTYTKSATPTSADQVLFHVNSSFVPYLEKSDASLISFATSASAVFKDSIFRITGSADTTKLAAFEIDGFTAGVTRTFTLPNYDATLATIAGTETFTNKTLTSPTITAPSITSATFSSYIQIAEQAAPSTPTNAARLFVDTSNRFSWIGENGFVRTFDGTANTADRVYTLPNVTGNVLVDTGTAINYTAGTGWKPSANSTTAMLWYKADGSTVIMTLDTTNKWLGIGTAPSVPLHVLSTTEAVRIAFDASNYMAITIGGTGNATIAPTGSTINFGNSTTGTIFVFTGKSGTSNNLSFDNATDSNPDITLSSTSDRYLNIVNSNTGTFGLIVEGKAGFGMTTTPGTTVHATLENATTNAIDNVVTIAHNTTGTAAAGFGSGLLFTGESSTTADTNMALVVTAWTTATHASRAAYIAISAYDTAAREGLRVEASGTAAMIGFFGTAPAVKQTSGANLTNNVTSGGTDDTIANFTDLTTYATDAATIRNDIYQLARKLKQINDGLRTLGLFT